MAKKFATQFTSATPISPSFVYVLPSEGYEGMFAVGTLYVASSSATLQSASGIVKTFDLKQHMVRTEEEVKTWAANWLSEKFKCPTSLTEVSTDGN